MKKIISYIYQNKISLAKKFSPALIVLGIVALWPWRSVEATVNSVARIFGEKKLSPEAEKRIFFTPVVEKLFAAGADTTFVEEIFSDSNTQFQERLVKINVTGYRKPADYSHNYSDEAIALSKEFLTKNKEILEAAEKKYDVPKETIAAIMWVETKQGRITGSNHLPSVFLSVAMSDQEEFIQKNIDVVRAEFADTTVKEFSEAVDKIRARAKKKSSWAVNELLYLQKIHQEKNIPAGSIYGSWAGAFGWSQFLPSSYIRSAVDGNNDGKADLFNLEDAAYSIGNYLRKAGWSTSEDSHRKAVFNYNNSTDYVNAVLKHAELVSDESKFTSQRKKHFKKKHSKKKKFLRKHSSKKKLRRHR